MWQEEKLKNRDRTEVKCGCGEYELTEVWMIVSATLPSPQQGNTTTVFFVAIQQYSVLSIAMYECDFGASTSRPELSFGRR